jgi:hypothetical protein
MAIIKQAKNIEITVKNHYTLKTNKLIKIADKINIEAKYGNLELHSAKKVQAKGNATSEQKKPNR